MRDEVVEAVEDEERAHPIATGWRPMLEAVVRAVAEGDLGLERGVAGVEPVSADKAEHMRRYLEDYGATVVELPEAAWETSVAQWMGGHWDVLVDLWTAEEGASDLVLMGQMRVVDGAPRFAVDMIFVP